MPAGAVAALLLFASAGGLGSSAPRAAAPRYGPEKLPPVADGDDPLVDAAALVPGLVVRLRYSTADNVTGKALYPKEARCWLRRSVAERLAQAARALERRGLRLLAWDCNRSAAAQAALWKAMPQAGSVADPARGSLHQRGVAVDLGLVGRDGREVPLPTGFDQFGPGARADAPLPKGPALDNREALLGAMHAAGFRVNPKEWWHFSRLWGWRWPIAELPR